MVYKFVIFIQYSYILDKDTRNLIWFHVSKVVEDEENGDTQFCVGEEVYFDIQISTRGKKPGSPKAINIRIMNGIGFKKIPPIQI